MTVTIAAGLVTPSTFAVTEFVPTATGVAIPSAVIVAAVPDLVKIADPGETATTFPCPSSAENTSWEAEDPRVSVAGVTATDFTTADNDTLVNEAEVHPMVSLAEAVPTKAPV